MEKIKRIGDPQEGKYYELKFSIPIICLCLGKDDCIVRWLFWVGGEVKFINIYFIGDEIINDICL